MAREVGRGRASSRDRPRIGTLVLTAVNALTHAKKPTWPGGDGFEQVQRNPGMPTSQLTSSWAVGWGYDLGCLHLGWWGQWRAGREGQMELGLTLSQPRGLHEQATEVRIGLSLLSETVTGVTDDCSRLD